MKRIFCLVAILCLLLCSCSKATEPIAEPEPAPAPVYGAAPMPCDKNVLVDGKKITVYGADTQYVKVRDFAQTFSFEFTVSEGIETHTANLKNGQTQIDFSTQNKSIYDGKDWYAPLSDVIKISEYSFFEDSEKAVTYYTSIVKSDDIAEGFTVPTFMYHAVSDDCWGIESLFVKPSNMEAQIKYLVDNGYTPIFFEDLKNVENIQKPVLLTFDDGYDDNYTELFPILKKYNVKATIFMITGFVGEKYYLTEAQIKEMAESGLVSFQSHTVTHPFLSDVHGDKLYHEIYDSKIELARITGKEPFVLCYPTGKYSQESLDAIKDHYQFGLLMSGANYVTGTNPYKITRNYVRRTTSLDSFKNMLQ